MRRLVFLSLVTWVCWPASASAQLPPTQPVAQPAGVTDTNASQLDSVDEDSVESGEESTRYRTRRRRTRRRRTRYRSRRTRRRRRLNRPVRPAVRRMWLDVEMGYRLGLGGPAGRVPTFREISGGGESPGVWDRAGRAWHIEGRLILRRLPVTFATARYESYHASRAGAGPSVLTAGLGYAKTFSDRYAGGVARPRVWDRGGRYDAMGRRCVRNSPDPYRRCTYRRSGGEWTRSAISYGPGVARGWAGAWLGWRQISGFLQGAEPEQSNPIGDVGGPVIGIQGLVQGSLWVATMRHELIYYLTEKPGDQGSLGYAGRFAGGLPWLLVELQWRSDPGSGGEFTFGLLARLPVLF